MMNMLIAGIALFILVHISPRLMPNLKVQAVAKLGHNGYRGIFSLLVLSAFALIIFGWRSSSAIEHVYTPIPALRHLAMLIMVFSFILFGAAKAPVKLKRYIRHPQLMSLVLWAFAHLLANGECRSVILFGSLGGWALIQIFLINIREGAYVKPEIEGWSRDIKVIVISLVIMVIAMFGHRWFTGVPLF